MQIRSDRTFLVAASRSDVWRALCDVDAYTTWWPWLRSFDADALAPDAVWRCTIRPPMPYTIRCAVHLVAVAPATTVSAAVSGDISGDARVVLDDDPGGTRIRLVTALAPSGRWIGLVARVVPPLARWGHDRVIRNAAGQFSAALTRTGDRVS